MIVRLFHFLHLIFVLHEVHGYASSQMCSGYGGWVRGGAYNQMKIATYSISTNQCLLSISPNKGYYNRSQIFTVTLTSPTLYGMKYVSVGGGNFSVVTKGGKLVGVDCVDYDREKTSTQVKFQAPAQGGEVRIKALCGTNEKSMNVANDIVLQPGADVSPIQAQVSSDPNYAFQKSLTSQLTLFFKKNTTHVNLKLLFATTGYLSFGTGSAMVGGIVLVGMDPTSNPGYNAIGLYDLKAKAGTNAQIAQLLASSSQLANYGIFGASYSVLNSQASLTFSVLLSNQNAQFTMINPSGGGVNVVYAAGPSAFSLHSIAGSLMGIDFASGLGGGPSADSGSSGLPPVQNTPGTTSTDPNYDYMKTLNQVMTLFYKTNATHAKFKLAMTSPGYVSLGVGSQMVGSVALIGLDTTANAGYPQVGLYSVNAKSGTNAQVSPLLSSGTTALYSSYGLSEISYSTVSGTSALLFTIELAKQVNSLEFIGKGVSVVFAGGPVAYGMHLYAGILSNVDFTTSISGGTYFVLNTNMAIHIVTMIMAWGLLSPIGVLIPMYNSIKHGPAMCKISGRNGFRLHLVLLTLGVVCGYIGTLTGYLYVEY